MHEFLCIKLDANADEYLKELKMSKFPCLDGGEGKDL
jgi:hypothetical protein